MLATRGQMSVYRLGLGVRSTSRFQHPEGVKAYEDDYAPEAVYPKIDPVWNRMPHYAKKKRDDYLAWHKKIRDNKTVEGKAIEFNIPHKYGYYCYMLNEDTIQYDSLLFHQFITRTHVMPTGEWPLAYSSPQLEEKVKHFANQLNGPLLDTLKFVFDGIARRPDEDELLTDVIQKESELAVEQVSRVILQVLSREEPYYLDAQVEWKPRNDAFWLCGGFARTKVEKKILENAPKWTRNRPVQVTKETDPKEQNFQFMGLPILQIRSEYPIGTLMDEESLEQLRKESEPQSFFPYSPQDFFAYRKLRYPTNLAGHLSADKAKSNLLTFHSNKHLYRRDAKDFESPAFQARIPSLVRSQGVLVSFAKLWAQANAMGYDQFADLQEPLSSQTIITNGRDWYFNAYQLNTIQLDKTSLADNKRQNVFWSLPSMKILEEDGKLNPNVVTQLLKCYLLPTLAERRTPAMPYYGCSLDDVPNDYERRLIHMNFNYIYSQKYSHRTPYPEIHLWEKIYKIDNPTRPMDPRRRHFEIPAEVKTKPYWEKLQIMCPDYEPKMLKKMKAEVAKKKEEERLQAVRDSAKAKFHQHDDEEDEEEPEGERDQKV